MKRIWTYHAAVFLGAFLLFQIQPMMSKALLPVFGGSYLVWGACMVFFQGMLLLGYAYAHFAQRWIGVARYARLHILVLLLPFLSLPFSFGDGSAGTGLPLSIEVFVLLLRAVGLPFVVLSTTSLILQSWLSVSTEPQKDNPYVLYSASNLGSMLALLTYPVVVEPFLGLAMQGCVWWAGYVLLVALHAICLSMMSRGSNREELRTSNIEHRTPNAEGKDVCVLRRSLFGVGCSMFNIRAWLLLSVAGCAVLLAVTNAMTLDIAPVPLLWVLPLSVYLLSFVLTFKQKVYYPSWIRSLLPWALLVGVLLHLMGQLRLSLPVWLSILLHLSILFCACMNCSGRLILAKPENPRHLTLFYLVMAFGGLVGSGVVSWVFPLVSSSLLEYPVSLVLVAASMAVSERHGHGPVSGPAPRAGIGRDTVVGLLVVLLALTAVPWAAARFLSRAAFTDSLLLAAIALPVALCLRRVADRPWPLAVLLLGAAVGMNWTDGLAAGTKSVRQLRNFYGIYRVFDKENVRYLQHGSTQHGRQYLNGPKRRTPLAYFHPTTPAAGVLTSSLFRFNRIDMIGLGTGALAAYAGAGQQFVIRELDPDNIHIAETDFTYVRMAREQGARLSYVVGDGRVTLRRERAGTLDLLIIDAFNSGSIPVHLLTVEAFEDYFRALKPDGLILLHISNKFLSLAPVVYSNARSVGAHACEKSNEGNRDADADQTYWMALSKSARPVEILKTGLGWGQAADLDLPRPWTDQYSNIVGAMFLK